MLFQLENLSSFFIILAPFLIFIILAYILYKLHPSKTLKYILIVAIILPGLSLIWRLVTNFTYYRNAFAEKFFSIFIFPSCLTPILILLISIIIIIELCKCKKVSKKAKRTFKAGEISKARKYIYIVSLVILIAGIIGIIVSTLLLRNADAEAGIIIMIFYFTAYIAAPYIFLFLLLISKIISWIKSSTAEKKKNKFSFIISIVILILIISPLFVSLYNRYQRMSISSMLNSPNTSEKEIRKLYLEKSVQTNENNYLCDIARHASTPLDILYEINQNSKVRLCLLTNPNIPPEILADLYNFCLSCRLSSDFPCYGCEEDLARSSSTPPEILSELYYKQLNKDPRNNWVIKQLIKNPNTPPDILELINNQ